MFQVRNKKRKIIIGEVSVSDPEKVLEELAMAAGSSVEEIIQSLGKNAEEACAALEIVELPEPQKASGRKRVQLDELPRRRLFG
ncbi:MAG: hypothetical protein JWM36_4371 [Hyphomicrobiales bacterium]|nr:hypothetical protein [Hyphomicrobiales bacterium]